MNKRFPLTLRWFLGWVVLVSFALAGCGGESPEGGKTTLRFVAWKFNNPEAWETIFSAFEEAHPEIRLLREFAPHSSTQFHALLSQKLQNQDPAMDVFLMDVIWPPEFAAAGWARPLGDFFPEDERRKFLKGPILANTFRGKFYGVPLFIDSGLLYYRKDLLEKHGFQPPETWEELARQAEAILRAERPSQPALQGYSGQFKQYEGLICDMLEFVRSNGGAFLSPVGDRALVDAPPAVEAVRFVRDRVIGKLAPRGVLTYQEPESLALFSQGNAVFHRNWPYAWAILNDSEKSKVTEKVGVAKLPHFPSGKSVSALGGWQVGISRFSKHPEAAWKFVSFVTSPAMQKVLAVQAGRAPTRKALYQDAEVLKANPHFREFFDIFLTAYPRPRTPLYPQVTNALQAYFSAAISDPASDIPGLASEVSRNLDRILALEKGKSGE
ncbi:MAG: ABC transporter substrate-binding protein [Nitrospinota bacterium]